MMSPPPLPGFQTGQQNGFRGIRFPDMIQLRRWESLLVESKGLPVYEEACRYLGLAAEHGSMGLHTLRSFWLQFQQVVMNALQKQGADLQKLLPVLDCGSKAQSLQDMCIVIQKVTAYFDCGNETRGYDKGVVEQTKKFVENNLDQALSVGQIASALYMNADYLSRLFKIETGIPLKEYILNRKMLSAQVLLKTTTLPVGIIASKLGYDNFSHFSQVYRKTMGLSPTDERREK